MTEDWKKFMCPYCHIKHQINVWSYLNAGKQQTISKVLEILEDDTNSREDCIKKVNEL